MPAALAYAKEALQCNPRNLRHGSHHHPHLDAWTQTHRTGRPASVMMTDAAVRGHVHGPAKEIQVLKGVFDQARKVRARIRLPRPAAASAHAVR
jgi:hypothetical protein